jgi:carbonic anhydrase/acetyltransferase-like protein (isoleucine patch superfamily)
MERNYKFTNETKTIIHPIIGEEVVLHQIQATEDMSQHNIKKGDIGGWIQSYDNLKGDAWVGDDAKVFGCAKVFGDARVFDNACVYGNTQVYGNARVRGNARMRGDAKVYGDAWVIGDAMVYGNARVFENALVFENAWVFGDALVFENAWVYGNTKVYDRAKVYGKARVFNNAEIFGNAEVTGGFIRFGMEINGNAFIQSDNEYCSFNNFGSQNRSTIAYKTKDGDVMVQCGCFNGSLDEFEKRVKETHGDSKYGKEYSMMIEMIKIKLGN